MITHANLCSQVEALRDNIPLDATCRLASIVPLSHLFEFTCGLLYPLSQGAAIHYIPSRRAPDILRVLNEQRITHMIAVPQLLTMMGQRLDEQLRAQLPPRVYGAMNALAARLPLAARHTLFWPVHRKLGGHLQMMASGGAALPAETQRLWERLGVRIVQGYGASECSPCIAAGAADGSTPLGSVGKPIRGVQVKLSNEGELLVQGPNVMRGYWHDPAKTAEVLQDGWYATGDLATIDAQGYIFLAGRAKDLIVLPSGMKVWPQDVEEVLRADAAVKDAAVIAVPKPNGGATLHAYLLAPDGQPADPGQLGEIVARCNARLAQHQRIATASWWPESDFPRTTGLQKVRRPLLPLPTEGVAGQTGRVVQVENTAAADDPVGQAIAGAARASAVQSRQTLADLGLDSLALVELALALEEKTGKTVTDADLRPDMTVDQVRAFVATAPESDAYLRPHRTAGEQTEVEQPLWPYTWGRVFRRLSLPFDVLYRFTITRTIVLGSEHLAHLPPRVIFAGTHHGRADSVLVQHALSRTAARRLARRLVIPAAARTFGSGIFGWYGVLAHGLYPLRQYGERDASLRGLVRLAEAGNAVLIFPQGTYARPEQEQAGDPAVAFRPGVAHLAAALNAAVVPFGIAGTEQVMPPDLQGYHGPTIFGRPAVLRRGPLAIAFGPPLTPDPGEPPPAFAARLQSASYRLTHQAEEALCRSTSPRAPK
jgi:long-chain acyl-CoA synthetase